MNHIIENILWDHGSLNAAEQRHLSECAACRHQLAMVERIEDGIQNLPSAPVLVPERLRVLVFRRIREPLYRVWHILAAGSFVLVSPFFLRHYALNKEMQLSGDMLTVVFAGYGVLLLLLILPLSHRLFDLFSDGVHDFEHRVDAFLGDNPLRSMGGAIRKRVGF